MRLPYSGRGSSERGIRWGDWLAEFGPQVMALIIIFSGAVLLFSGAVPAPADRLAWLQDRVSLAVLEISHLSRVRGLRTYRPGARPVFAPQSYLSFDYGPTWNRHCSLPPAVSYQLIRVVLQNC